MPVPDPIKDIPEEKVGEIVQSFIDNDGVKELAVKRQKNGAYTVTPVK
jgi:hypothetical protein